MVICKFRVAERKYQIFKTICAKQGINMSTILRVAVDQYINKYTDINLTIDDDNEVNTSSTTSTTSINSNITDKYTYLYFIGWNNGPIKIGITDNVIDRIQRLQTGCPHELNVISLYKSADRRMIYAIEQTLHKMFSKHKLQGEWFENEVVKAYLDNCGHELAPNVIYAGKNYIHSINNRKIQFQDNKKIKKYAQIKKM